MGRGQILHPCILKILSLNSFFLHQLFFFFLWCIWSGVISRLQQTTVFSCSTLLQYLAWYFYSALWSIFTSVKWYAPTVQGSSMVVHSFVLFSITSFYLPNPVLMTILSRHFTMPTYCIVIKRFQHQTSDICYSIISKNVTSGPSTSSCRMFLIISCQS